MATKIVYRDLGKALFDEGLLPPNCQLVEVIIPPHEPPTIRYSVFIAQEDLPKFARALLRVAGATEDGDGG